MVDYCSALIKNLPLKNDFGVSSLRRADNDERLLIASAIDLLNYMKILPENKDVPTPLYQSSKSIRDAYESDPSGRESETFYKSG